MSYDQMSIKEKELEAAKYKVVIFVSTNVYALFCTYIFQDESHMLKEPKAKRTKMAIKVAVSILNIGYAYYIFRDLQIEKSS
jgi:hypothetical protein